MLRQKCPECKWKCRVEDAVPMADRFGINLFFNCGMHGEFSKIKTIKGLLK